MPGAVFLKVGARSSDEPPLKGGGRMIRYFQRAAIDDYVRSVINEDRDILRVVDPWGVDRDEVIKILVAHYRRIGIFYVTPMALDFAMYEDIQIQLQVNRQLQHYVQSVREEVERLKNRQNRR